MSKFLAGLVRKSAGLPSPVAVRPAIGPQNISAPVDAQRTPTALSGSTTVLAGEIEASSRPLAAPPVEPPAPGSGPRRGSARAHTIEQASSEMERPSSALRTEPRAVWTFDRVRDRIQGLAPESVRLTPRRSDGNEKPSLTGTALSHPGLSASGAVSIKQSVEAAREPIAASNASRPRRELARQETESVLPPIKVVPRPQAAIAIPAATKRSPNALGQNQGPSEQRSIQVKIGRVEIRSTQPAPPVRAARKQATSGFADLAVARTYRDRSGW